jgi:hypothetical protein
MLKIKKDEKNGGFINAVPPDRNLSLFPIAAIRARYRTPRCPNL